MSSPTRSNPGCGECRGWEAHRGSGDRRRGGAARLSTTAKLQVLAASPGVAPISGELAVVLAEIRRAIGALRAKLGRGICSGRIRENRGGEWCEGNEQGWPPFIAS